jgi:hypothetical protein
MVSVLQDSKNYIQYKNKNSHIIISLYKNKSKFFFIIILYISVHPHSFY